MCLRMIKACTIYQPSNPVTNNVKEEMRVNTRHLVTQIGNYQSSPPMIVFLKHIPITKRHAVYKDLRCDSQQNNKRIYSSTDLKLHVILSQTDHPSPEWEEAGLAFLCK